jgi:single-stranded DNA-binding protein
MNSVALTGILVDDPDLREVDAEPVRCTMRLAVPRHDRGGRRTAGVVYVAVTTFGFEARDCAERLRRGDRIGVTGRIEQDKYRTPEGWRASDRSLRRPLPPPTARRSQLQEPVEVRQTWEDETTLAKQAA